MRRSGGRLRGSELIYQGTRHSSFKKFALQERDDFNVVLFGYRGVSVQPPRSHAVGSTQWRLDLEGACWNQLKGFFSATGYSFR